MTKFSHSKTIASSPHEEVVGECDSCKGETHQPLDIMLALIVHEHSSHSVSSSLKNETDAYEKSSYSQCQAR